MLHGHSKETPGFVGASTGISHYFLMADKIVGLEVGVAVGDLVVGMSVGDPVVGKPVGVLVGLVVGMDVAVDVGLAVEELVWLEVGMVVEADEVGLAVRVAVGGINPHDIGPILKTILCKPVLLETRYSPSVMLRKIAGRGGDSSIVNKVGVTIVGITLS